MSGRPSVAAFTDTYLPTVNGVTYTIDSWRTHWPSDQMAVVYPDAQHTPRANEHPVRSLPFPFYDGYRAGVPRTPTELQTFAADVVHTHTPAALGLAGLRYARRQDLPLVATFHTPLEEYVDYVVPSVIESTVERGMTRYQRWFFEQADAVITPSPETEHHLTETLGAAVTTHVISNGIDTEMFTPVETAAFLHRHELPTDRPLIGYTGRHGHEKQLSRILEAASHLEDVTVVFGGDGPARGQLEAEADLLDVDARFLGFLDREELPAFYSALDVFTFPSPVETEGLVAKEAIACGTPVVGVDDGALASTIDHGTTGYLSDGELETFCAHIRRAMRNSTALREGCLTARESFNIAATLDQVADVYHQVQ